MLTNRRTFIQQLSGAFMAANLESATANTQADPSLGNQTSPHREGTLVILHRGALDHAMENSLSAYEYAFLYQADGVGLDIRKTQDGTLVVYHDPWIDRTVDYYGNIDEYSLEELQLYAFREPRGGTNGNERIPTLDQALQLCRSFNGLLHLNLKVPGIDTAVMQSIEQQGMIEHVVGIDTANAAALLNDKRFHPALPQGNLIDGANDYDGAAVQRILNRPQKGTVSVNDSRAIGTLLHRNFSPSKKEQPPALNFSPTVSMDKLTAIANGQTTSQSLTPKQAAARLFLSYPQQGWKYAFECILNSRGDTFLTWMWILGRLGTMHTLSYDGRMFVLNYIKNQTEENWLEVLAEACGSIRLGEARPAIVDILKSHPPVRAFALDPKQQAKDRLRIRLRAAAAKTLGRISNSQHKDAIEVLRNMVLDRSVHIDGAYMGLDGAEAVKALIQLENKENEAIYIQSILYKDDRLFQAAKDETMPESIRTSGTHWDFRMRNEALAALGQINTDRSRQGLQSILEMSQDVADSIGTDLQGGAARAICSGTMKLTSQDLHSLLSHPNPSVQRAACVYLTNNRDVRFDDLRKQFIPWYFDMR